MGRVIGHRREYALNDSYWMPEWTTRDFRVRSELYRLLLDEEAGIASALVPRMLADPDSLTPEIRWCLFYLIRGIGYLAGRNRLFGQDGLLDTLSEEFEIARLRTRRLDNLWSEIVKEDPNHWMQRYESTEVHYSLEELDWLNELLGRLWEVERQRLALEEPPLQPLVLRKRLVAAGQRQKFLANLLPRLN